VAGRADPRQAPADDQDIQVFQRGRHAWPFGDDSWMEDRDLSQRAERRSARQAAMRRQRAAVGLGLVGAFALIAGLVVGAGEDTEPRVTTTARDAAPELPRGGRSLLPEFRLVGYYGAPQSEELGALGIGSPEDAGTELAHQADPYESNEAPVLPVFELLATIAAAEAGVDGRHRLHQPHAVIQRYLQEARRQRAILLLDIQPGRADFADEFDRLRRYLREPDVGLALDPEWHVGPAEVPGQVIGSVTAAEVNEISAELAAIVARGNLPEKLFVIHQFTPEMIVNREQLVAREGLATVVNIDGFGDRANKVVKYRELRPPQASGLYSGFKLFYREDTRLMSPADVLKLRPPPSLIVYE